MVATDDDQRAVEFANLFQLFQHDANRCVQGLHFAQVVSEILANFGHIRKEWRQLSLQ